MKEGEFIAALVLAILVVLFHIAFIWYIDSGKTCHIHSSATEKALTGAL